ncbi:MAG: gas vesicle protein GvpG [Prochlorotrichaceae cyanobacterium]
MLLELLTFPVLGPIKGVAWIGEQILERADFQQNDRQSLEKQLLALQLSFDLGDISEEDFEAKEEELLLALEECDAEDDDL